MPLEPVTDPELLKRLNAGPSTAPTKMEPVTDEALLAKLNTPPATTKDEPITAGGTAKAFGSGLVEGAAGTLGLPGDIEKAMMDYFNVPADARPFFRKFAPTEDVKSATSSALGAVDRGFWNPQAENPSLHYPENQTERYAFSGGKGISSTMFPGAPLRATGVLGLLGGLGGEAGAQLLGDDQNGSTMGRVAGTAIPLGVGFGALAVPRAGAKALGGLIHMLPDRALATIMKAIPKTLETVGVTADNLKSVPSLAAAIAKSMFQQQIHAGTPGPVPEVTRGGMASGTIRY